MLPEKSREAAGRRWMRAFDALYENKYGYRPREKKTEEKDNDQMSMF